MNKKEPAKKWAEKKVYARLYSGEKDGVHHAKCPFCGKVNRMSCGAVEVSAVKTFYNCRHFELWNWVQRNNRRFVEVYFKMKARG